MKEAETMRKRKKKQLSELPDDVLKAGKKAGKRFSKVIDEFKEFISRGNVTDLAVGVIVGTSFTAIVNALAHDVLMPLMGLLIGGIDLTSLSFTVNSFIFANFSVTVAYGKFLQAVVTFLIIAISVFFMVKALNIIRRKKPDESPKPDAQVLLLSEIRNLLRDGCLVIDDGEFKQLTFDELDKTDDSETPSPSYKRSSATLCPLPCAPSKSKSSG